MLRFDKHDRLCYLFCFVDLVYIAFYEEAYYDTVFLILELEVGAQVDGRVRSTKSLGTDMAVVYPRITSDIDSNFLGIRYP